VVAWGSPGNLVTAPLVISQCEFTRLGGVLGSGTVPSGSFALEFHDNTGPCAEPGGTSLPGGFGWIDHPGGSCSTTTTASVWAAEKPGLSAPAGCRPSTWIGRAVVLPIFVDTNGLGGSNGQYRIGGYVGFEVTGQRFPSSPNPTPGLRCPSGALRAAVLAAVATLGAGGETALYDTLVTIARDVPPVGDPGRRAVVLLSDGGDTVSTATLSDALNVARSVRIEVIELASPESSQPALAAIAASGGGSIATVANLGALATTCELTARNLLDGPPADGADASPDTVMNAPAPHAGTVDAALDRLDTVGVAATGPSPIVGVGLVLLAVAVLAVVGAVTVGVLAVPVVAIGAPLGARVWLSTRATSRRNKFLAALPDLLQVIVAMLRSGYRFLQALDAVGSEADEPARSEIRRVLLEVRAGRDLADALGAMATRLDAADLEWIVDAVEINQTVGGDLAHVLDTVASTIRVRQRLRRQVSALTAEGRVSAYVMMGLPPGVAVALVIMDPAYFARLTEGVGLVLLGGAGVSLVVGYPWMRRMIGSVHRGVGHERDGVGGGAHRRGSVRRRRDAADPRVPAGAPRRTTRSCADRWGRPPRGG